MARPINYVLVYQTETDGEIQVETIESIAEVIEISETLHDEIAIISGSIVRHFDDRASVAEAMEDEFPHFALPKSEGPLDDPGVYCCDFLKHQLSGTCRGPDGHTTDTTQCPDQMICYSSKLRHYALAPIGLPGYSIHFCPSCGTKFPENLRDEWFDEIEKLGLDPWEDDDKLPEKYRNDSWWKHVNPDCSFSKQKGAPCDLKHLPLNQLCKPCQKYIEKGDY